ncbi:MAG: hypothetical protein M3Y50_09265 [Acidobacteriota bacterium]|nr:hypothetical protein [Acidobacteriota bacterium]
MNAPPSIVRERRWLALTLLLVATRLHCQSPGANPNPAPNPNVDSAPAPALSHHRAEASLQPLTQLVYPAASSSLPNPPNASGLPDAPGEPQSTQSNVVAVAESSFKRTGDGERPCGIFSATKVIYVEPTHFDERNKPCAELINPYQRFLNTNIAIPLTWQQKGYLALHDLTDPANFATILGISAISIGSNAHTAYGPGLSGFGKIVGVSLLQDATGQFFGVFAIPSLAHQDPRYYRMTKATLPHRILYSISRTVISRHDDGTSMPNYSALLGYPIGAEIGNLYVPGIHTDGASTATRILTGLATDPANNLLTEFLPDVAKHIHIRIIFVQTVLNNIARPEAGPGLQ